jgi:hypothetical protein
VHPFFYPYSVYFTLKYIKIELAKDGGSCNIKLCQFAYNGTKRINLLPNKKKKSRKSSRAATVSGGSKIEKRGLG